MSSALYMHNTKEERGFCVPHHPKIFIEVSHILAVFWTCILKVNELSLLYRTVLWTLWERERVGRFGRMALKHVKYHV